MSTDLNADWTVTTDTWTLRTLREAKAYRDANPDPAYAEIDAHWNAYLAACEAAVAETGAVTEREPAADTPARPTGGNGATNYGSTRNAPSEAQLRFLASLSRDLGHELQTPRDKSHASLIIDGAKKELDRRRREGVAPAAPERKATERQRELIANLLTERVYDLDVDVDALNPRQASELIDRLFAAPRAKVAAHGIREGYYAYSPDGGMTADHYRVRRSGRIVVWTAGGEHPYNGKLNEGLEWIKANPREAAELFGRLVGTCGRCGRDLSDDDSRARGLGPVCAGKSEW
jgi:hypothetical protein